MKSTISASFSLTRAPHTHIAGGSSAVIRVSLVSPSDLRNTHRPIIPAIWPKTKPQINQITIYSSIMWWVTKCSLPRTEPITWNRFTSRPSSTQSKITSDNFVASYNFKTIFYFSTKSFTQSTDTKWICMFFSSPPDNTKQWKKNTCFAFGTASIR